MSLTTRCPACGTTFKVVPDQLRISEGWVRCGQCAEVFDANAALKPVSTPAAAPSPRAVAAPPPPLKPTPKPTATTAPAPAPVAKFVPSVTARPSTAPVRKSAAREVQGEPPDSDVAPLVLVRPDAEGPDSRTLVNDTQPPNEPPVLASRFHGEIDDEDDDEVSFVRRRPLPKVERRSVRIVLNLAVVAFVLLLLGQVAVHDRDRLAATHAALRPLLETLCEPLGCRLGAPRLIESLVIDSSTFIKLRSDAYRLSVTLKNKAPMEVAMPALELTLTDTQEQAVVRRVLLPAELAAGTPTIAAGGEWSGSLALSVGASGSESRIAGYRVLAFYP